MDLSVFSGREMFGINSKIDKNTKSKSKNRENRNFETALVPRRSSKILDPAWNKPRETALI